MSDHDESLEVGLAAGMDAPTAMVISARDGKPARRRIRKSGCSPFLPFLICLIIAMLAGMVLVRLLH